MILSMTGFGSAHAEQAGISCSVEIRAVNNRFFKAAIKLPDKLTLLEPEVDRLLRDSIVRGSITLTMSVKDARATTSITINHNVLNEYVTQIKQLRQQFSADNARFPTTLDLAHIFALPGVVEAGDNTEEYLATHRELVLKMIRQATAGLLEMRQREGEALLLDLRKHLAIIHAALAKITELAPTVAKQYHEKLRTRVLQMVSDAKLSLSDSDLLKEVALFTDRSDISEEISRLAGHLEQFASVCQREDQGGRKLDFIAQEMLREANTIASKANDSAIARLIVDIKSSIDRIKEQVQNVE